MINNLELRMYGLVPYNISPIQQSIQFGHAVVEYGQNMKRIDKKNPLSIQYDDWADNWKTFIILNGGTSNHSVNRYKTKNDVFLGTMESNLELLQSNFVECATFYEPDLNDMLSAIVFIVDERVFNKKDYPDFGDWLIKNYGDLIINSDYERPEDIAKSIIKSNDKEDKKSYQTWLNLIGGQKNAFLRDFLKNFKLA